MKFICLLLLLITTVVNSTQYVTFIPYIDSECVGSEITGPTPYGIGYSFQTDQCINNIDGFAGQTSITDDSFYFQVDDSNTQVTILQTQSSSTTKCLNDINPIKTTYENGSCVILPNFNSNLNGTYDLPNTNQYAKVIISDKPGAPSFTVVFEVYRNSFYCSKTPTFNVIFSLNLILQSLNYTQSYLCINYIVSVENCHNNDCLTTPIDSNCLKTQYGHEQSYCPILIYP